MFFSFEELVDTDDSQLFTDVKMVPNELMQLGRRRRHLTLQDKFPQRRKRALSPFNFYDTDPVGRKHRSSYVDPFI